jgi:hypothetical protein
MPNRHNADDLLAVALAGGATMESAAAQAGVGKTTAWRRSKEPAFRAKVASLRSEMVSRALGHLSEGCGEAAITLRHLMLKSEDERIKSGCAKAILTILSRLRENIEISEQLEALRQQVEELKDAKSHKD